MTVERPPETIIYHRKTQQEPFPQTGWYHAKLELHVRRGFIPEIDDVIARVLPSNLGLMPEVVGKNLLKSSRL